MAIDPLSDKFAAYWLESQILPSGYHVVDSCKSPKNRPGRPTSSAPPQPFSIWHSLANPKLASDVSLTEGYAQLFVDLQYILVELYSQKTEAGGGGDGGGGGGANSRVDGIKKQQQQQHTRAVEVKNAAAGGLGGGKHPPVETHGLKGNATTHDRGPKGGADEPDISSTPVVVKAGGGPGDAAFGNTQNPLTADESQPQPHDAYAEGSVTKSHTRHTSGAEAEEGAIPPLFPVVRVYLNDKAVFQTAVGVMGPALPVDELDEDEARTEQENKNLALKSKHRVELREQLRVGVHTPSSLLTIQLFEKDFCPDISMSEILLASATLPIHSLLVEKNLDLVVSVHCTLPQYYSLQSLCGPTAVVGGASGGGAHANANAHSSSTAHTHTHTLAPNANPDAYGSAANAAYGASASNAAFTATANASASAYSSAYGAATAKPTGYTNPFSHTTSPNDAALPPAHDPVAIVARLHVSLQLRTNASNALTHALNEIAALSLPRGPWTPQALVDPVVEDDELVAITGCDIFSIASDQGIVSVWSLVESVGSLMFALTASADEVGSEAVVMHLKHVKTDIPQEERLRMTYVAIIEDLFTLTEYLVVGPAARVSKFIHEMTHFQRPLSALGLILAVWLPFAPFATFHSHAQANCTAPPSAASSFAASASLLYNPLFAWLILFFVTEARIATRPTVAASHSFTSLIAKVQQIQGFEMITRPLEQSLSVDIVWRIRIFELWVKALKIRVLRDATQHNTEHFQTALFRFASNPTRLVLIGVLCYFKRARVAAAMGAAFLGTMMFCRHIPIVAASFNCVRGFRRYAELRRLRNKV